MLTNNGLRFMPNQGIRSTGSVSRCVLAFVNGMVMRNS